MEQKKDTLDANRALLDTLQLAQLEQEFRLWAAGAKGGARRVSRIRIVLFFLIIRYTGAKLKEVLTLLPRTNLDSTKQRITFQVPGDEVREVEISQHLAQELETMLSSVPKEELEQFFMIDPAYIRRKFYERAVACGFCKEQGGPEMLRKARVVELVQNNLPLPAVQRLLGRSSGHLASLEQLGFSNGELSELTQLYLERESGGKTSARNNFFGKVRGLKQDNLQTLVETGTLDGGVLWTMVTNTSARRLGLRIGRMITAEVKAPWLILEHCDRPGLSGADNMREGIIIKITSGDINTECIVRLPDGTEMCAILSSQGFARLGLGQGEVVRVLFSAYAVVLHSD